MFTKGKNKNELELSIIIPVTINSNAMSKYSIDSPTKVFPRCEYTLNFDGCSKGNPGPSGIGAVIYRITNEEWSGCQYIGIKTNNQSEYSALILGLKESISRNIKQLYVNGDSLLVINQVNGVFKVKNSKLFELYQEVIELIKQFEYIEFNHVYREHNKRADQLSNLALDVLDVNAQNNNTGLVLPSEDIDIISLKQSKKTQPIHILNRNENVMRQCLFPDIKLTK